MYAFIQRLLVQRIGSPLDKLPHVTHLGEQPVIGRADQRGTLLKFRQLDHAFVREVKHPSSCIIIIILMLYKTKAYKFGDFLHHQLMRMPQFPR